MIDLPGVNAQEKTKAELIDSLKIGTQEMLDTEITFEPITFEPNATMTTISVPDPEWMVNAER